VIVGAATGGQSGAILLYEAALGVGLSIGPLLGALLGSISWRGPFLGTAILMAGALVLCAVFLKSDKHEQREPIKLLDPLSVRRTVSGIRPHTSRHGERDTHAEPPRRSPHARGVCTGVSRGPR
jgi:MFS family permease